MTITVSPWNLTPHQAQALDAIVETGCHKLAARKLFLSEKTIEIHSARARKLIGAPNRVLALLAWDRWRRESNTGPRAAAAALEQLRKDGERESAYQS